MDTILQSIILILCIAAVGYSVARTGDWINPVTILCAVFFLPLFFSLFRLSGLQANEWQYNTYLAIFTAIGAWLIFPVLVMAIKASPRSSFDSAAFKRLPQSPYFVAAARIFGLIIIGCYAASNLIQAGDLLTFRHPELAFEIHATFPPGLRFFARAGIAAAVLLYIAYWSRRKKVDLLLLVLVLAVPLTRLSRIDLAMSLFALGVLFATLPLFRLTFRNCLLILLVMTALIAGAAELGSLRQNRFGQYSFKYSSFILWRPEWVGPYEIFPIAYGYFALTFENFDSYIRQFRGDYGIVVGSFDWLFSGFLKLNWFSSYLRVQAEVNQFTPVSNAANVPTALTPFYADLGPIGMAIPMLLYASFWLYLYYKSKNNLHALVLYCIYCGAFSLVAFQAIITAPFLIYQMVDAAIILGLAQTLEKARQSRLRVVERNKNMRTAERLQVT